MLIVYTCKWGQINDKGFGKKMHGQQALLFILQRWSEYDPDYIPN